jgi:hypothetical protein
LSIAKLLYNIDGAMYLVCNEHDKILNENMGINTFKWIVEICDNLMQLYEYITFFKQCICQYDLDFIIWHLAYLSIPSLSQHYWVYQMICVNTQTICKKYFIAYFMEFNLSIVKYFLIN